MNTKQFLEAILPSDAVCLVATKLPTGFKHRGFSDFGEAAQYIAECDAKSMETYHACAGYKQEPYMLNGKLITRTGVNWKSAKAFWCDIDCGASKAEKGQGYPSQKEAVVALFKWCDNRGFPKPMLINSGNGIHAYWLLSEPIEAEPWRDLANRLKEGMRADGLLVDPTRTADFSSILRPVGTHNWKDPQNPKEVKWVFGGDATIAPDVMKSLIDGLVPAKQENTVTKTDYPEREYSAKLCADKCAQMAKMRDTQGDVGYEHWRGVIGIIKHCTEGVELAREWSAQRQATGHTQLDVDLRYDSWNAGPTTCEFFGNCNGEGCANCPFKGRITSPIQLGVIEETPKPETVKGVVEGAEIRGEVEIEIPACPKGFFWDEHRKAMCGMVYDTKLKENVETPFTPIRLFLYDRIRDEFGEHYFMCRALFPQSYVRDFKLAGSVIGGSCTKLLEELGKYEVMTCRGKNAGELMQSYLKGQVSTLSETTKVNRTYGHFGWQEDGSFVIGNRRYDKDGKVTEVLLGESAREQRGAFPLPQGTVEAYAERVNWIYNRPGMEPMQYLICSLWGAPLVPFMEPTYNGIPCALTGADSGKGKTTAAQVALYAFGRAHPDLTLAGARGSTVGGQAKFLGVLKNLPVLFDEVTNKTPQQLSNICYELSNGVEVMRLRPSGGHVGFGERAAWRTQTAMTGNANIGAKLALNGNAEAEAMRVFEICTDNLDIPRLDPVITATKVAEIAQNAGSAGEVYIKWLVMHREEISRMLTDTYEHIKVDKLLVSQPKYRFYRNHLACTLTAAKIMKQLGVIGFDLDAMVKFGLDAVRECFNQAAELVGVDDPMELLSSMLTSFGGQIAVTPTLDVEVGSELYKVYCPQGLIGRAVRANAGKSDIYDGKLFLSAKDASEWCAANRVPKGKFMHQLKALGVLLDTRKFCTVGRGTTAVTAQQRCWELDLNKLELPSGVEDGDQS